MDGSFTVCTPPPTGHCRPLLYPARVTPAQVARNLRLLQVFWFLREAQLWIPVWIVFLTIDQGFSLTEVLTAEGLYLVAIVFLEVPTGAVADRWGRKQSLTMGALFLGLAVLIFSFATTYPVLLCSFFLWSLAHTLMSGADQALLFDTLKAAGREQEYERRAGRAVSLTWGGAGLATFAGGPVAGFLSTESTIYIGAATCVAAAVAAVTLSEPPHGRGSHTESYWRSIGSAFREVRSAPGVRRVVFLIGIAGAAANGAFYLVQPFLVDRGVEVGIWFSWLQVPLLAAGVVGGMLAGRLGTRHSARLLTLLPAGVVVGMVMLGAAPGFYAFALMPVVVGLESVFRPLADGYINRRVGSERRATVLSMRGMVNSFVAAAVASSIGWLTDNAGIEWAFFGCAALALVAVLAFRVPSTDRSIPPALLQNRPPA